MNDLEIEKVLVLSLAHITKVSNEWLENGGGSSIIMDSYWYGYRIFVDPHPIGMDMVHESVFECIDLARENGCSYVKLDRDGPCVDELQKYDW